MSELRGTLEHIPVIDEVLKDEGISGLLVGGLARVFHIAQQSRERAEAVLPRKDTDVLILNDGNKDVKLHDVDVFRRYNYAGIWHPNDAIEHGGNFAYWRNRFSCLDVSFPNIDILNLPAGLHIPDEVFLERMFARWRLAMSYPYYHSGRLPSRLENCDPVFDVKLLKAKFHRALRGDPERVVSMDKVEVRPLTGFEKYCIASGHEVSYPAL